MTNSATGRRLTGFVVCWALFSGAAQAARPAHLLAGFERATGIVETSGHTCLKLDLYLADSAPQQRQGLMRIEQLGATEGMLFRYGTPAVITMWMKNTLISLDMLFIRADGRIASIARHTQPLSTARIAAAEPVSMVLELNAGFADRKKIRTGNRLLAVN